MPGSVVLASASPRRAELLGRAGILVDVRPSDCDETPLPGEHPIALTRRLALAKVNAANVTDRVVLGADTAVWLADATLGKPASIEEARAMLQMLRGREHHVTTAFALGGSVPSEVHDVTTTVWMRPLADDELDAYLASGEWRDKAGAYGIQGLAAAFVTRIDGSYTAVVGLPLAEVIVRLRALGVTP